MPKYYRLIADGTALDRLSGANAVVPPEFKDLSSSLTSTCTYLQSLLQHVIFVTHGAELLEAKRTLRTFPNPKARIDFLCSYPYSDADPVLWAVFDYARSLFRDLYELRNILSHEVWASSDAHNGAVLFSSLDEEARLLMVSGRIWHAEEATSQEVYDGMVRYIRSVKVITCDNLRSALSDADLCAWILMHIGTVLNEPDPTPRQEARRLFLHFGGTSHLFEGEPLTTGTLTFNASKSKDIHR